MAIDIDDTARPEMPAQQAQQPTQKRGPGRRAGQTPADMARLRGEIEQMRTWGYSVRQIGRTLDLSEGTIRHHLQVLDAERVAHALPTLNVRLARSIDDTDALLREAYKIITNPDLPSNAMARTSAMQIVLQCLERRDELQGTKNPDSTNAAAVAEAYGIMLQTLLEVGGEALQQQYVLRLTQRLSKAGHGVLLSAPSAVGAQTVDADNDDEEYDEGLTDIKEDDEDAQDSDQSEYNADADDDDGVEDY